MAGHSKWNNIKNRKGAVDAKRGKIFTQLSKLIKTAVKEGGSGDPQSNAALRLAMDKARAANMPKEKIQKAIDRGLGKSTSGASLQEIIYEGYGPGGVGFLINAVTDNANRTSSEIKYIFSRSGGSLGGPGSVAYMFERNQAGDYETTMPMIITDEKEQQALQKVIDNLRENDDVEDVFCVGEWGDKA
jgi:YebC/PmpR family DNA-binding regulatory protein